MPGGVVTLRVGGHAAACHATGAGRPLVLVHGAGGCGALWAAQLDGLGDRARVLAPDLPGHGDTPGPGRRTVAAYAQWLVALLDALGLGRVVLGGHSMGGAIAQAVALTHPGRLAGLVLVGTGARLRVAPRILELFRAGSLEGPRLVGGFAYAAATPPERVAAADRALGATAMLVTLGDFLACDAFDVLGEVSRICTPALVVVGREDRLTPPKYAAALVREIPGARLVEILDAGHFLQLEQPAAVNDAIRSFLGGLA